ncbi:ATS4 metalloproteinase, partial [Ramphastos sulfuratus]|nr:ATS4 metalloproteinase [Ramphastos sulfuratus]
SPSPTSRFPQRFVSVPRFVEMLVVADESMARFHGAGLRRYLLTVLAAAARSFRHGSLGNAVELRVSRMLVLGQDTPGPPPTSNAAQMLRDFCRWQQGLNVPDEDSALHFDTAILFTRLVGGSWGCSLGRVLGCPLRCLGHIFNMVHDTSQACQELNGHTGASRRVMAPVLSSLEPGQMWSPCSARSITDFLDNGHGTSWHSEPGTALPSGATSHRG